MSKSILAWFKANRPLWVGIASLVMLFAVVSVAHADSRVFTLRYDVLLPGANIRQIGNTLMTCSGNSNACTNAKSASNNIVNDQLNMQFVDLDGDGTTTSSSSADMSGLPGTFVVLRAQLYWGGSFNPFNASGQSGANQMKFKKDGQSYITVTADNFDYVDETAGGDTGRGYGATADITNLVPAGYWANVKYWGANVKATTGCTSGDGCDDGTMGNYAGWALLLVYQDTSDSTTRYVGIDDGLQCVYNGTCTDGSGSKQITFTGFNIPPGSSNQRWGLLTWDGDKGIDGDSLVLEGTTQSNTLRTSNNYFRGAIAVNQNPVTTRNPNDLNTLGIDIAETTGSNFSGSEIDAVFNTSGDFYVPQYFWIVGDSPPVNSDYGDAPSSYGSASHIIDNDSPTKLRMGTSTTDADTSSRNSPPNATNALGDDLLGNTPDDETGVSTFPAFTSATTSYCIDVTATNTLGAGEANVFGWLDLNHDGDFDTGEYVASTGIANGNTNVTRQLCWNSFPTVPAGTNLYLRLRLTTQDLTSAQATGSAPNGEVEDYRIVVTNPTAAHLGTFHAKSSRKQVKLMWNTGSELDVSGFNLYRSTRKDGDYVKVNDELIPAQNIGSATGSDYIYKNKKLKPNKVYWYKLEVVGRGGTLEMSDPLKVKTKPPKS